ncbi:MAG: formylmethanofuran dehydrogenase subunit C [Rhizobacter sp.]|nr:formylmethanofuran dehydrogenase subunit C [Rhizobacter sp.]
MSGWRLTLRQAPAVRVDLRGVLPAALAGLSAAQVGQVRVGHGKALVPLAEFFAIQPDGNDDALAFEGDLARFDRLGWQMAGGRITADGPAGDYAGGCMSGGELHVKGSVGLLAACEMAGGQLTIDGDAGDFAASTLPGSMDGMRGGTLIVKGDVGERFGDRMRRGTALVFGNAGDFLASRMVAGTIGIGGQAGVHVGYGMRRGSVVFTAAAPSIAATFVPALVEAAVFWQLLARDLACHGGPFAGLPSRRTERHLGDLAADGRGELIVAR